MLSIPTILSEKRTVAAIYTAMNHGYKYTNMKAIIERVYLETETLGSWYVDGVMICKTLELPWKGNQRGISCIPEGTYEVVREEKSAHHEYPHFRILNVKERDGILVHKITYVSGLKGCVGVGEFKDLNGDNVPDIINSGINLQHLYDIMPDKFTLEIKKKK
jgi:hypothetical protein